MTTNYFIVNKQEFIDYQSHIEVWNKASEAANKAFIDVIGDNINDVIKQAASSKLQLQLIVLAKNYFNLKQTMIGTVWTNNSGKHFTRCFGSKDRSNVDQIQEDIAKMISGDFDHYVIIDENHHVISWDQFNMILVVCNQDF